MDRTFLVAQATGGNLNPPRIVKLTKPDLNQAVTIPLDGTVEVDLSLIANTPVTFVHSDDRLVILFDNNATITLEPFFSSDGTPLPNITVELAPDRSVSGTEFASLFPITSDQTVLPAAGNGTPASGADFQPVTIDQVLGTTTPLGLLAPDSPNGNAAGPNGNDTVAINALVVGPTVTVVAAAGSEDKPIALSITEALSIADPRTSLGNITITGIPAGVHFNQGTLNADGKTLTLTPAQLAGVTLTSDGEAQHFNLTVTATTLDNGNSASTTTTLHVDVTPVADAPLLTVATASGNEDHPIALNIQPALAEADADAAIARVAIAGIPSGVHFNQGTLSPDGKTLTLTPAQLANLTLTSDGEVQHFNLTVTATTVDGGSTATAASTTKTLHVDVTPVADAPVVNVTNASGNEDQAIALNIQPVLSEADADAAITSVTITGIPAGVTFSQGTVSPDGKTLTLTPAQLAGLTLTGDGEVQHFDLTVTATTVDGGNTATAASTRATLHVDVTPVADAPTLTVGSVGPASLVLNLPGQDIQAVAINDAGTIVGATENAAGGFGFVLPAAATTPTILNFGNATAASGINSPGEIVGALIPAGGGPFHGFLLNPDGTRTPINVPDPNTVDTQPTGINDSGEIVGNAFINGKGFVGFVDQGGTFSIINIQGRGTTLVGGVDNAGDIVGTFSTDLTHAHGFILQGGATPPVIFDIPGATITEITGINNSGVFVGTFGNATSGLNHGFVDDHGTIITFDLPGAISAIPTGINDAGQIVGIFNDGHQTSVFEATIPGIGLEDQPITLGIQAALGEVDHDAVLTVTITGIPAGVTFSAGTLSPDGKTLTLTPAQLANLTLTSDGEAQHFDLTVTATTVDGGDVATEASTTKTLHIDVTPVADTPILTLVSSSRSRVTPPISPPPTSRSAAPKFSSRT